MKDRMLLLAAAVLACLMISGSCPNRSSSDDFMTSVRQVRDSITRPAGEITLRPGEHVVDIDVNCLTTDPECLVIVTRPMYRRETPRTLTLHLPYARRPMPASITVREMPRPRP